MENLNPQFLNKKFNLNKTEEVDDAVRRHEQRTGETVGQNSNERVQVYLDRFNEILTRTDPDHREQGLEALKKMLHKKFVLSPEEIPDSYWELQQRIAREQGHGDFTMSDALKERDTYVLIRDQKQSLNLWVNYLASN